MSPVLSLSTAENKIDMHIATSLNIKRTAQLIETEKILNYAPSAHVSPDQAFQWVTQFNYANQRDLKKSWVGTLAECMLRGKFASFTMITFAVLDGEPLLVNGQHTLHAIYQSNLTQTLMVQFRYVASHEELESLYSIFDIQRRRALRDQMGTIGADLNLSDGERNALAVAVKLLSLGMRPDFGRHDPHFQANLIDAEFIKAEMRSWAAESYKYFSFLRAAPASNRDIFMRSHVVAVALLTLRYCDAKAADFWTQACLDDGLRIGDPRKSLHNWLRSNPVTKAQFQQHRAAIACWNAFYRGKELYRVMPSTDAALTALGCEEYFTDPIFRRAA